MPKDKKKRIQRRKMRSYKKLKLFLLAFGLAGNAIGLAFCGYFSLKGNSSIRVSNLLPNFIN